MRVIKAIDHPSSAFRVSVQPWQCIEVVQSAADVPKGERYIVFDGAWSVYAKSKVHLAKPRYVGRYDNVLSAVHRARLN